MATFADKIYSTLRAGDLPPALCSLIVAQARVESANFTSHVFLSCNNAFGYKATGTAPKCTGSPEGDYYKKYASVADSAAEITAWIRRRQRDGIFPTDLTTILTPEQYAALLKKAGYYGSSQTAYASAMRGYWIQNKPPTGGLGVLAIATLLTALLITRK